MRIVASDGDRVVDELRPVETLDDPVFEWSVPAGRYRVTAVERPCEAMCPNLDPPADATRCELAVDVRPGRTARIAIALRATPAGPRSDCSTTTARF